MHAPCAPFFGMTFGHIFSLPFLGSSSVAAFRGPNSDSRNGVCFATSWHARELIAPETPHSHAAFLSIRPDSPSEGERCMKDTDHPVVHFLVHLRIFARVRRRRGLRMARRSIWTRTKHRIGLERPHFCTRFRAQSNSWGRSSPSSHSTRRVLLSAYGRAELRLRSRIDKARLSQR